ncbi:MAG: hypothetical protein ACKPKO_55790, partial [Candidatus Fonsibacter sp.]
MFSVLDKSITVIQPTGDREIQDDHIVLRRSEGALPASYNTKKRDMSYTECTVINEWLIDTGCGQDLLSKKDVANYRKFIRKADPPTVFHTANGKTITNNLAWIHVHELDENITPYVMATAPPVLTVGYR